MEKPEFLTLAELVEIHSDQIRQYGGIEGIRDMHLLQSALAQPESTFGGQWLHYDLYEMAAAYTFHLSQNQPFMDGNKRTALAAALVFLEINDISLLDPKGILLDLVLKLAAGKMTKKEFAVCLKNLPQD